MSALGGPPEVIGQKVAAALVGTFLGILLCYGAVGPLAANMGKLIEDEHAYYHVLRVMMLSFIKGYLRFWRSKWVAAPFPNMCGPPFRRWRKPAVRRTSRLPRNSGITGRLGTEWGTESLADVHQHPIIIKRKAIHAGHHGGAWKVAYADFVTAMMALFIVLWLLSASKEVQVTVGGYFRIRAVLRRM
jgi:hypothetical protein